MCQHPLLIENLLSDIKKVLIEKKDARGFGTGSARIALINSMMNQGLVVRQGWEQTYGKPSWRVSPCGRRAATLLINLEKYPHRRDALYEKFKQGRCPLDPPPSRPEQLTLFRYNPNGHYGSDARIRELERVFGYTSDIRVYRQLHIARLRAGLTQYEHPALGWIEDQINNIDPEETDIERIPTWEDLMVQIEGLFTDLADIHPYSLRGRFYYHSLREQLFALREPLIDANTLHSMFDDIIQEMANESAAEGWSYIGDMPYYDYGEELEPEDLWQYAKFGLAYAIDSDLIISGDGEYLRFRNEISLDPPEGFVRLNVGGDIPSTEQEIQTDHAIDRLASRLSVSDEFAITQLEESFTADGMEIPEYIYASASGEAQMYGNPDKVYERYIA
jgi:hypothetical protein